MVLQWCRFAAAALCLGIGLVFMLLAVFGVNRFHRALNRMHAAALGDTLGILFVLLSLIIIRGISMDSLKMLVVILFFWVASPVSGHMLSRLEAMTDDDLGEILVIQKDGSGQEYQKQHVGGEKNSSQHTDGEEPLKPHADGKENQDKSAGKVNSRDAGRKKKKPGENERRGSTGKKGGRK